MFFLPVLLSSDKTHTKRGTRTLIVTNIGTDKLSVTRTYTHMHSIKTQTRANVIIFDAYQNM